MTVVSGTPYKLDTERLIELHKSGLSANAIAERLNAHPRSITRLRAKLGLSQPSPRCQWRVSPEWLSEAGQLLDEGYSQSEVARTLGCTVQTMTRHFPGRGWTPQETGAYAVAIRNANRRLKKQGLKPLPATPVAKK